MMTQQAEIHGDWSMVEGPCAHREQAVPNGEWLMVEGEATKAVPNMSWADIVRIKADQKAIEEAQVRLQQQQWTQISSPNVTPPRREQEACAYESDEDLEEAKYQTSRKRSIDLNASRSKRIVQVARKQSNNRISGSHGGAYANCVFGRQYDVHGDREVRREMKQQGIWGR